jgi:hypothetical protein
MELGQHLLAMSDSLSIELFLGISIAIDISSLFSTFC